MVQANTPDEAEPDFKPKRSKLGLALALLAVLAGIAGVAFLLLKPKEAPLRVLVAVEADGHWWDGSTTAARLLDNVVPYLRKLGFDAIDGGDPEVVKLLEGAATPEEAARRLGARFVVTGPVRVETTDFGAKIGITEVRGSGTIHLAAVGSQPRAVGEIRTWAGAPEKDAALAFASEALGFQTFDVLL